MDSQRQTKKLVITKVIEEKVKKYSIILFNDDVNTFEFVIETLITVCGHEPLQAEQCAFLVHHKGKCEVKTGEYSKLLPMAEALLDKGLTAEIQ